MCKKILIVMFLNIVIALTMTSCSVEKKGDAPVETPVSSVSAVETPVLTPTEKPKLETVPWGEDSFTALLPECTYGAVTLITPGDDGLCLVMVEQIEENDVVAYMDKLSASGFSCVDESSDLYTAGRNYSNSSGITVNVVYSANIMTLMIQK